MSSSRAELSQIASSRARAEPKFVALCRASRRKTRAFLELFYCSHFGQNALIIVLNTKYYMSILLQKIIKFFKHHLNIFKKIFLTNQSPKSQIFVPKWHKIKACEKYHELEPCNFELELFRAFANVYRASSSFLATK